MIGSILSGLGKLASGVDGAVLLPTSGLWRTIEASSGLENQNLDDSDMLVGGACITGVCNFLELSVLRREFLGASTVGNVPLVIDGCTINFRELSREELCTT